MSKSTKPNPRAKQSRDRWTLLAGAIAALGVGFRLYDFLSNRSVWADEAKLALSILDHSPIELLHARLDYGQVAAPGFLLIQKAAVALLGPSEMALRLFPLLCSIAALGLVWALLEEMRAPRIAAVAALALLAISPYLVHYAADAKPYSTDVLACAAILLFTVRLTERGDRRSAWALGVAGALAIWLSLTAAFVLAAAVLALAAAALRGRLEPRRLGPVAAAWLLSGVAALTVAGPTLAPTQAFMQGYWSTGFLPFPPRTIQDVAAYGTAAVRLFAHPLGLYRLPLIGVATFLAGVAYLFRRRGMALPALVLGPIVLVMIAAAAHLYPLGGERSAVPGRVVLFLMPPLALGCAFGVAALWEARGLIPRSLGRGRAAIPPIAACLLLAAMLVQIAPWLPRYLKLYRVQSRQAAGFIAVHRRDGDHVYASGLIWSPLRFYDRSFGLGPITAVRAEEPLPLAPGTTRVWLVHYKAEPAPPPGPAVGAPILQLETNGVSVELRPAGTSVGGRR